MSVGTNHSSVICYGIWHRAGAQKEREPLSEPLSEPLFALPTTLLFAPVVHVIELVSVHPFVIQPGSSYL